MPNSKLQTTICPDCPDTGDCRANGCIREIGAAVAPIVPTPTYHHPGQNCDGSGHRTCPYSQWAEREIGRLRGIIRVNLLRGIEPAPATDTERECG